MQDLESRLRFAKMKQQLGGRYTAKFQRDITFGLGRVSDQPLGGRYGRPRFRPRDESETRHRAIASHSVARAERTDERRQCRLALAPLRQRMTCGEANIPIGIFQSIGQGGDNFSSVGIGWCDQGFAEGIGGVGTDQVVPIT